MNRSPNKWRNRGGPQKLATMLAVLLPIILINGCKTTATAVTDVDCDAFQPVQWSKKDTLKTVEQVKEHNAVWRSLCR